MSPTPPVPAKDDTVMLEQKRHSARLQTLYVVNDILRQVEADGLDLQLILPRVLRASVQELEGVSGSVLIVDETRRIVNAWVLTTLGEETRYNPFLDRVVADGFAGWVMRNRRPGLVENTVEDRRWLPHVGLTTAKDSRSAIGAPLVARGRAIGALTINRPGAFQFDLDDANLLAAIASQAAAMIENAWLYQESQRRAQELAGLLAATKVINSSLDINEIMHSLLEQRSRLLNAEALSIALVDKQTEELVFQVAEGTGSDKIVGLRLPANQGVTGWVMTHGEPALVPDTSLDSRFSSYGDERTGHPTRAIICAPLVVKGEMLGTIQAINPTNGAFTENDLELLVNLANLTSSAIANAQQFARTQAAEARYLGLFEDSIDPIILTDRFGNIVDANRRASDFFGYDREEFRQLRISSLHPIETGLLGENAFRPIQEKVKIFSSRAITNGQHRIPVEVHAKRLFTGDNELLQWIHHDISKQVELEEMREDLIAMLFHDLQSPLSNVIASLQMLRLELSPEENRSLNTLIEVAIRSTQKLQVLIRSLLDIHRLESGQPLGNLSYVSMRSLISEALDMIQAGLDRRNIAVKHLYDHRLPRVYVDEDMVRRVLVNLLDNALKFSPPNTALTISVTEPLIDDKLIASVSDQGPGIPEQYHNTVFDKFSRLQREESPVGMGIGLAFCRLAIEAHSGRIWVDDAPDGGARFNFTLPTKEF